ncbi:MAG: thiol reductant ABC exporter subunit CydC [Calditrichaeota bacterium]|nr:thiol reductant ABC exporter subunit CydC [Calditrichota bacterium]
MKIILRLLKLAFPYAKWIFLSVLLGSLTIASGIGLMMASAFIISAAALHPSIAELQVAIVGVRFFGISRGVFRYLERLTSHDTTFRLLSRFRVWFYRALEPLVPAKTLYFKSADLLQRIVSDIQNLENFYVRVISPPAVAVIVAVLMSFLLSTYHAQYAIIFLICYTLAATIIPFLSIQLSRRMGKRIIELKSELNVAILDNLRGMTELLTNNQLSAHRRKVTGLSRRLAMLQKKMQIIEALHQGFITLLMFGAVVLILVTAIPAVRADQLSGVYLAVLVLGVMAAFEGVLALPATAQYMESNTEAAKRLFGIIDRAPDVRDRDQALPLNPRKSPDLKLQNVTFTYSETDDPVLKNVSLFIPFPSKVAVVGPSGSGKSTLANLILRLWEVENGKILIGDADIRNIKQESLREAIGFVSQRFHLFTGTIADNLRLVNPELDEEEMLRLLNLVALTKEELGASSILDYRIGEHGARLSGGQAQRLAIAQVLAKNPSIFIFDEITANLDPKTEQQVLNNLFREFPDRTVINITHRLNLMKVYDRIYVLQNGRLIEEGRHEQLLRQNKIYRHIYLIQKENQLFR